MWRWVSTKPGITMAFEASITSALGAAMFGRTAEIFWPSTSTSACSKSPIARSSESTQPPLIRIGLPAAGGGVGCWAAAGPITLAAIVGAATAPAAVVHRNWRRDKLGAGPQQVQNAPVPECMNWVIVVLPSAL